MLETFSRFCISPYDMIYKHKVGLEMHLDAQNSTGNRIFRMTANNADFYSDKFQKIFNLY